MGSNDKGAVMATAEELARQADIAIQKAKDEISNLRERLEQGTLDRRRLESGLTLLVETVANIPPHGPVYSSGHCPKP